MSTDKEKNTLYDLISYTMSINYTEIRFFEYQNSSDLIYFLPDSYPHHLV